MNSLLNYSQPSPLLLRKDATTAEECFGVSQHFEIQTLEWMEMQTVSKNKLDKDKTKQFVLLWIKKGEGTLQVEDYRYEFANNSIYCIAPGHSRKYLAHSNVEGYYISFSAEFIQFSQGFTSNQAWLELSNNYFNVTTVAVDNEMQYDLEEIAHKMKREYSNYVNGRIDLLQSLLNIFVIYFSRNMSRDFQTNLITREGELVRKFMTLLKKNFVTEKMVSNYASHLCVTPNYLNRIVKKATGFAASYHIQQQIVLEAKRQARYCSVSMKEIAYALGFDNLAHFSKFFKNYCGVNFTDYKKGIQAVG